MNDDASTLASKNVRASTFQAYRVFADLTGQSLNTVRFCEPVIASDYVLVRNEPALVHPRSVFLVSRLYDYRVAQLRDLAPGSPNVAAAPYNGLPPPHLLLGYQYVYRTLNDYMFENRVFMQIGFDSPPIQRPRRLFWTCLTDCSYSVNVGDYVRFLDLQNFHGTFQQMHNAVLMDRVAADLQRAHLRGRGVDLGADGRLLPPPPPPPHHRQPLDGERHGYLTGAGAAGLREDVLLRTGSADDALLLGAIRNLRVALCHFLFCYARDAFVTESAYRFLPGSDVYDDEDWLSLFTDAFANLDTQELVRRAQREERMPWINDDPVETMAKCFLSTLAADARDASADLPEIAGGAYRLRNRTVSDRPGLRPRDRYGRAVTAEQMRRQRRRVVRRFVDRLPVRRRRRRRARPAEAAVAEAAEEERPGPSRALLPPEVLLEEIAPGAGREEEEEEEEEGLLGEVLRAAVEAIGALQDELSGPARRHELFQFAAAFYRLLIRARELGMVTESFLRKWVLYFFLCEHVASTLYYLYSHFVANREFRRYVDVTTVQVLITGWDVNAEQVFRRIWSEQSNPAHVFETLWERVLRDCLMMVERTGQFEGMDEADQQIFLSDIQYRDRSGDVEEVLRQLNLSEELIDSVDISFRLKYRGIVAITTNRRIVDNLHRILRDRQHDREIQRLVAQRRRGR